MLYLLSRYDGIHVYPVNVNLDNRVCYMAVSSAMCVCADMDIIHHCCYSAVSWAVGVYIAVSNECPYNAIS